MALNPVDLLRPKPEGEEAPAPPLAGSRSQSMQRLQVGLFGLGAMVLLVGLANIIGDNADQAEASVVTEAAPAAPAEEVIVPFRDPLAEAGVVPDMAEEADKPEATLEGDEPPSEP